MLEGGEGEGGCCGGRGGGSASVLFNKAQAVQVGTVGRVGLVPACTCAPTALLLFWWTTLHNNLTQHKHQARVAGSGGADWGGGGGGLYAQPATNWGIP